MSAPHLSIRRRLLTMLIPTILLIWLIVSLMVYRSAQREVEAVFDADMARSAEILQSLLLHEVDEEQAQRAVIQQVKDEVGDAGLQAYPYLASVLRGLGKEERTERVELVRRAQDAGNRYGAGLTFVARYADGSIMMRDPHAPQIPSGPSGFSDVTMDGELWRIFDLSDPETGFAVQVGERRAFRSGLVRHITRNALMPLVLVLPILALLIYAVVGRALRPLQQVAAQVSVRDPRTLEAIDDSNTPKEVQSLVTALNELFNRVGAAIRRERQFTADAAHELRTPLAALKTHLQVARGKADEETMRHSLDQALAGVDRATHSMGQLLSLARADAEQTRALVNVPVDLREVALNVVAALSQQAVERDIDLGLEAPGNALVRGDATALEVMLRNLVDNAIRYTPLGGTVTVSLGVSSGKAWLLVADTGAGVPVADRERIFDRFHRGAGEQAAGVSGSGLGLSIVQRIVGVHHAAISLEQGLDGRGLGVRVEFPAF